MMAIKIRTCNFCGNAYIQGKKTLSNSLSDKKLFTASNINSCEECIDSLANEPYAIVGKPNRKPDTSINSIQTIG